jgi:peroxiredoxin
VAKVVAEEIQVDISSLGSCLVQNELGESVRLGEAWKTHPAILIFLRHFACIACRAHAGNVWKDRAKLEQNGAKIYFVGVGSATYIRKFKEDLGISEATMFSDPSLLSFRLAGFKRGFLASHSPRSVANQVKLAREGHSFGKLEKGTGDLWQLGGTLVVAPDDRVTYQYISQAQGDFPPESDF